VEAHGLPWLFSVYIVAKLLCSCLCLLDASIELHAMDERNGQWLNKSQELFAIYFDGRPHAFFCPQISLADFNFSLKYTCSYFGTTRLMSQLGLWRYWEVLCCLQQATLSCGEGVYQIHETPFTKYKVTRQKQRNINVRFMLTCNVRSPP